jgi:hypothetical protein
MVRRLNAREKLIDEGNVCVNVSGLSVEIKQRTISVTPYYGRCLHC